MGYSLLQTKLYIPRLRPRTIPRPNLTGLLNQGPEQGYKLTLVCAPAGFGKTTLVTEWVQTLKRTTAWFSIDEGDNDPARFLAYFIAAVQSLQPELGRDVQAALQSPQPPPIEVVLTGLINSLTAVHTPFVVVLDDYHLIEAQPIHDMLAFILEHQPPQLHLIIITRADPLLPLARLRARGEIIELRESDLRFTIDEAAVLLNQSLGLALTPTQIKTLQQRTEGWIAGLQLAAHSLQGRGDIPSFIKSFSGSSRFILDYLTDEVLQNRPVGTRDFLLQTSILTRLSGPLCDAVTGENTGQTTLERLEQASLFITSLDESRGWYRYHRLFAELLQYRLRTQYKLPEAALHQRASQWYETNGYLADAIHHALAAQDMERACVLIDQACDAMLKSGQLVTIIDWCRKLPDDIIRSRPSLGMSFAWALLLVGQLDEADNLLASIETLVQDMPPLLGQVFTAQAYSARVRGENGRVIEKSQQALALLPKDERNSRSILTLNLGLVYWHEGRLAEAEPVLLAARESSEQLGNEYGILAAQIFLARTRASQGKLRQAEAMYRQFLPDDSRVPILALAHYDLSALYYEWNELEKASEYADKGLALSEHSRNIEFQNAAYMLRASIKLAQGKTADALQAVETSHRLARDFSPITQARSASLHMEMALALGDLDKAVYWGEQVKEDVSTHSFYRFLGLARPRLLIALGQKEEAVERLDACYATASQAGWGYGIIATRVLQALAAVTPEAALEFLIDALGLAAPDGSIRTFVDAGELIVPLLQKVAAQGVYPGYVERILAVMAGESRDVPPLSTSLSLVEPPSERELEILNLLADRQTNSEIALALTVSVNTIKTHLQHIYEKLGVHDRRTAVIKAKEIGLI